MGLRDRSPAWLLGVAQLTMTALCAAVAGVVADARTAVAAGFGGLVVLLPGLWFARRVRLRGAAADPKQVLGAFYRAEFWKLLWVALGFYIGAKWFGGQFAALMLTCVACLAMNWVVLAVKTTQSV